MKGRGAAHSHKLKQTKKPVAKKQHHHLQHHLHHHKRALADVPGSAVRLPLSPVRFAGARKLPPLGATPLALGSPAKSFLATSGVAPSFQLDRHRALLTREYQEAYRLQKERLKRQIRSELEGTTGRMVDEAASTAAVIEDLLYSVAPQVQPSPSALTLAIDGSGEGSGEPCHRRSSARSERVREGSIVVVEKDDGGGTGSKDDDAVSLADTDASLFVTIEGRELAITCRKWFVEHGLLALRVYNKAFQKFADQLDRDAQGSIDYKEWELYVKTVLRNHERGSPASYDNHVDELLSKMLVGLFGGSRDFGQCAYNLFVLIDDNMSGTITRNELRGGLMRMGVLHFNFEHRGEPLRFAEQALCCFGTRSTLRRRCVWLMKHPYFDRFVLTLIVVNSILLAFEDYVDPQQNSWRNKMVAAAEEPFLVLFTLEMVVKVIGMGFVMGEGSYLQDPWNWIDFLVVATGAALYVPAIPKFNSLRTFRVLRPLRTLSSLPGMKVLVGSVLNSLPGLANVLLLLLFAFAIFGIAGVQIFAGATHYHCKATPFPVNGVWADADGSRNCAINASKYQFACPAGQTCGSDFAPPPGYSVKRVQEAEDFNFGFTTFDNFFLATLTIFQIITMENWSHIMYMTMGSVTSASAVYYLVLVVFGSFFLMNLVFAVIWDKFSRSAAFQNDKVEDDGSQLSAHSSDSCSESSAGSANTADDALQEQVDKLRAKAQTKVLNAQGREGIDQDGRRHLVAKRARKGDDVHFLQSGDIFAERGGIARRLTGASLAETGINNSEGALVLAEQPDKPDRLTTEALERHTKRSESFKYQKGKPVDRPKPRKMPQWRLDVRKFVERKDFSTFIICCIVCNTVVLAIDDYNPKRSAQQAADHHKKLEQVNLWLTFTFLFEMVVKLVGFGWRGYVADRFNTFDGTIVVISLIELFLKETGLLGKSSGVSALRLFRVFRVFKLARSWTSLNNVIRTVMVTMVESVNFALLLFLAIYIFTLVGMQFFSTYFRFDPDTGVKVKWDPLNASHPNFHLPSDALAPYEIPNTNFDDLIGAFTAVFQVLSGEDWNNVMYDCIRARGYTVGVTYFLALIIIGNLIVLNLFLAILLGNFAVDVEPVKEFVEEEVKKPSRWRKLMVLLGLESGTAKVVPIRDTFTSKAVGENWLYQERKTSVSSQGSTGAEHAQNAQARRRLHKLHMEGTSFYCLTTKSPFRRSVAKIAVSKTFEVFIIALILASSITLALDNPRGNPDSAMAKAFDLFNFVTTWVFVSEVVIRCIHNGCIVYIKEGWNQLDFVIVVVSLIDEFSKGSNVSYLRAVRSLRALRPLRLIARFPNMKRVVDTMIATLPQAASVTGVCALFFLIFGIFGVSQFKGKLFTCDGLSEGDAAMVEDNYGLEAYPYNTFKKHFYKSNCTALGGEWKNADQNFDNTFAAMLTLIQMSTTEGWVDVMNSGIDGTGVDMHPVRGWRRGYTFYFVLFIIVGSFFAVNLFVGAVIDAFTSLKETNETSTGSYMTPTQREWVDTQLMMAKAKLKPQFVPPTNPFRKWCYAVSSRHDFELFIMGCILANTVVLATTSYQQSQEITDVQTLLNYIFAVIFTIELIMKLAGLGCRFFLDGWNVFDLVVVVATDAAIFLALFTDIDLGGIAGLARAIRMLLIFRILKSQKGMQTLINTVVVNVPSLGNISSVLGLLLFIYAAMGTQLFGNVAAGENLGEDVHFQTFARAFLTMFRACTGEAWNSLMFECMLQPIEGATTFLPDEGGSCVQNPTYAQTQAAVAKTNNPLEAIGCGTSPSLAYGFFLSFVVFATFIMLNLFVAVILEGFGDEQYEGEKTLSDEQFAQFCGIWQTFDPDATYKVNGDSVISFLKRLPPPLGVKGYMLTEKEVRIFAGSLNLPDSHGFVQFRDMCAALARHVYLDAALRAGLEEEDIDKVHISSLAHTKEHWVEHKYSEAPDGLVATWEMRVAAKAFQTMWLRVLAKREANALVEAKRKAMTAAGIASVNIRRGLSTSLKLSQNLGSAVVPSGVATVGSAMQSGANLLKDKLTTNISPNLTTPNLTPTPTHTLK